MRPRCHSTMLDSAQKIKKKKKKSRSCHKLTCLNAYVIRLKVVLPLTPPVHKGEAVIS